MYDLSIITSTYRRSKHLTIVCEQIKQQSVQGIQIEHIVVSDGPDERAATIAREAGAKFRELSGHYGHVGAACNDMGTKMAQGEYLIYFDDDNFYYPHAVASLFSTAHGVDIGVCRTYHNGIYIPSKLSTPFTYGDIDTMCLCVRAELAKKIEWRMAKSGATDFHFLQTAMKHKPSVRFSPVVIGKHLT